MGKDFEIKSKIVRKAELEREIKGLKQLLSKPQSKWEKWRKPPVSELVEYIDMVVYYYSRLSILEAELKGINSTEAEFEKEKANVQDLAFKEGKRVMIEEAYNDIGCIYNNLQDDLQLDKKGEQGYKTEVESNKAVRKYTWKVVKRLCDKWEKRWEPRRNEKCLGMIDDNRNINIEDCKNNCKFYKDCLEIIKRRKIVGGKK